MELLSCPRDTLPQAWSVLIAANRSLPGSERVGRLLASSTTITGLAPNAAREENALDNLEKFFARVIEGLQQAGVDYMVVGSFASTYHGMPRTTRDLDVVCQLDATALADLLARFPAEDGFYVSQEAAAEAVRRRGMFNIVHAASGWKVDIIVKKSRSFSQREFARRLAVRLLDQTVFVASAEDTILTKLEWARTSLSERQLRDVSEILDVQGEALDQEYLASGLAELGLEDVMARARGPW